MVEVSEIDGWLAEREAAEAGVRPGCEKRVVWNKSSGVKTSLSVLYIHGFSSSGEELRPLPDLVAKGLGANMYFTRLTGHGQDGDALGRATFAAWKKDVTEALDVAHVIGDHVIIMGCSTGCTLATLALAYGAKVRAVVFVSPNFGLRNRFLQALLDLPGAERWAPIIAGKRRHFEVKNDGHRAYWTTEYPTKAIFPMADAVRAVRKANLGGVSTPAMFAFNEDDQVVNPAEIKKVMARWGGRVEAVTLTQGPCDDEIGHVMAGDIFSPNQTEPLAARILAWFKGL